MKSVFKVGSRANIHLTSDKRVFGEIVSANDEFVEILELNGVEICEFTSKH